MLFNSIPFMFLFAIVFAAHRTVPTAYSRNVLLIGSLIFYSMWIPIYLGLFVGVLAVNFLLQRRMVRSEQPRSWMIVSVTFSLVVLGFFKYAAFLVSSIIPALNAVGMPAPGVPEVLLPLGISFFTFQIIALTVDTYRGRIEPVERFSEYALFVSPSALN